MLPQLILKTEYSIVAWRGGESYVVEEGFETQEEARKAISYYKSLPSWDDCSFHIEKNPQCEYER